MYMCMYACRRHCTVCVCVCACLCVVRRSVRPRACEPAGKGAGGTKEWACRPHRSVISLWREAMSACVRACVNGARTTRAKRKHRRENDSGKRQKNKNKNNTSPQRRRRRRRRGELHPSTTRIFFNLHRADVTLIADHDQTENSTHNMTTQHTRASAGRVVVVVWLSLIHI